MAAGQRYLVRVLNEAEYQKAVYLNQTGTLHIINFYESAGRGQIGGLIRGLIRKSCGRPQEAGANVLESEGVARPATDREILKTDQDGKRGLSVRFDGSKQAR
jgi:hypothetical protein